MHSTLSIDWFQHLVSSTVILIHQSVDGSRRELLTSSIGLDRKAAPSQLEQAPLLITQAVSLIVIGPSV